VEPCTRLLNVVLPKKQVRADMKRNPVPQFEMRHRMSIALEWGSVSVNDIARELGCSRTTISNYLHGRTQPRRSDLIAWGFKCGVPFEWLVGGDADSLVDDEPAAVPAKKAVKPVKAARKKSA